MIGETVDEYVLHGLHVFEARITVSKIIIMAFKASFHSE